MNQETVYPQTNSAGGRLRSCARLLAQTETLVASGTVTRVTGLVVESLGPAVCIGDLCLFQSRDGQPKTLLEVIGFRDSTVLSMPLGPMPRIQAGDVLLAVPNEGKGAPVGMTYVGRIVDALGQPLDGRGKIHAEARYPLHRAATNPLERRSISQALSTGVRVIDGLLTVGVGQRVGIFGGSGVGKSTLLGMMAKHTSADLNVIAMIGERGREVRDFIERELGEEGLRRSVMMVSTSDDAPLVRIRAALAATAIAEYFRDQGASVLLIMDSVTRFATAQREVGLAAGEPPSSRGYTPSVFSLLPRLLERAGNFASGGAITGFYTVLVEGDDMNEPIADAVRGILDGHFVLSRALAARNHYPCLDVLESRSRLFSEITDPAHQQQAGKLRELLAEYHRHEDLISIGAYQPGANPHLDQAVRLHPAMRNFLQQQRRAAVSLPDSIAQLSHLFEADGKLL